MTTQIKIMKQLDSYSLLIVANYLKNKEDYLNIIQVCKNYKKNIKKISI